MKYLAICIPNYERIDKLERLVSITAEQIQQDCLEDSVQICVSDDCSQQNPSDLIEVLKGKYPKVEIIFHRNETNRGMDYNFLKSVMMANSIYCWIVGNDDMPALNGIQTVVHCLQDRGNEVDIMVTPFDVYDDNDGYRATVYPFGSELDSRHTYDTSIQSQYDELIQNVKHNCAIFGFLSNVIFKRKYWEQYQNQFQGMMDSIFIQMYMNTQALVDGVKYEYFPQKVIVNYADDNTNNKIERICRILLGLDGVVEYFFEGKNKIHIKKTIIDPYINGIIYDLPENSVFREKIMNINSPKKPLYDKYYIKKSEREEFLNFHKIIIYGAGDYGKKTYDEACLYGADVLGIVDSDEKKWGTRFENSLIISPEKLCELYRKKEFYIVVASNIYLEEIIMWLLKMRMERIAIIK